MGDHVMPITLGVGTWATHSIVNESDLLKLSGVTDNVFAALLQRVVLPAYFLVHDMIELKPEDWLCPECCFFSRWSDGYSICTAAGSA